MSADTAPPAQLSTAAAIDDVLAESTRRPWHDVPRVVVMVANKERVLYAGSAGYAQLPPFGATPEELDTEEKVDPDSVFELWSCTKLVTMIGILQLVERGQLNMTDDATMYVPELAEVRILRGFDESGEAILEENNTVVTLEMLADHTAGFSYEHPNIERYRAKYGVPQPYEEDATLETLIATPFVNTPGEHWDYGTSVDWLSVILEVVTGVTLEDYFQTNILRPLEITDTSFIPNPRKINLVDVPEESGKPYTVRPGFPFPQKRHFGGAGLCGSSRSFLTLLQTLLRGGVGPNGVRILSEKIAELMFTPQLKTPLLQNDITTLWKLDGDPYTNKAVKATPGVEWAYGGLLCPNELESGRQPNSMTWAGLANSFFVIDRETGIAFM
ncbi:beta-lactamase [Pseudohyphozyma bogoriensis]|nr:beta-lactamase [Pseudohyphozyma bogoriensis]